MGGKARGGNKGEGMEGKGGPGKEERKERGGEKEEKIGEERGRVASWLLGDGCPAFI